MTRVPIHLLLIVAIFCAVAVCVKSDDATWADVSSDPDLQVIALEPTSFLDGEDCKAAHFGDSFSGYKWILRLYLVSPQLSFSQRSSLKQGQPILRC
jgi:hypothetical protein